MPAFHPPPGPQVPATVPGGVWDNLLRAGVVGDPLYRDNAVTYASVTASGNAFAFTKNFDAPAEFHASTDSVVLIEFDGIQTLANVSLNGVDIVTANNMFRKWRSPLPPSALKATGNVLRVSMMSTAPPAGFPSNLPDGIAGVGIRTEADSYVCLLSFPPREWARIVETKDLVK
jgi:hypothetical protein